jgi:hypothetical protein
MLGDVDEFSCADSKARAEAEFASQTRFRLSQVHLESQKNILMNA